MKKSIIKSARIEKNLNFGLLEILFNDGSKEYVVTYYNREYKGYFNGVYFDKYTDANLYYKDELEKLNTN